MRFTSKSLALLIAVIMAFSAVFAVVSVNSDNDSDALSPPPADWIDDRITLNVYPYWSSFLSIYAKVGKTTIHVPTLAFESVVFHGFHVSDTSIVVEPDDVVHFDHEHGALWVMVSNEFYTELAEQTATTYGNQVVVSGYASAVKVGGGVENFALNIAIQPDYVISFSGSYSLPGHPVQYRPSVYSVLYFNGPTGAVITGSEIFDDAIYGQYGQLHVQGPFAPGEYVATVTSSESPPYDVEFVLYEPYIPDSLLGDSDPGDGNDNGDTDPSDDEDITIDVYSLITIIDIILTIILIIALYKKRC